MKKREDGKILSIIVTNDKQPQIHSGAIFHDAHFEVDYSSQNGYNDSMFMTGLCAFMRSRRRTGAVVALVLLALCLSLSGCSQRRQGDAADGVQVLIDGVRWDGRAVSPEDGDTRVYITLDGRPLIDLPFDEAHTVTVRQDDLGENTVELTGEAVYMSHADCENQDCVEMGEVTRQNMELRVLGGFIVCLPHRLSVEVRSE